MEPQRRRRVFIPLFFSMVALGTFFRTPGAETVRAVQMVLLFTSGALAGVGLAGLLGRRGR